MNLGKTLFAQLYLQGLAHPRLATWSGHVFKNSLNPACAPDKLFGPTAHFLIGKEEPCRTKI